MKTNVFLMIAAPLLKDLDLSHNVVEFNGPALDDNVQETTAQLTILKAELNIFRKRDEPVNGDKPNIDLYVASTHTD